jgi:hypothetical protein
MPLLKVLAVMIPLSLLAAWWSRPKSNLAPESQLR